MESKEVWRQNLNEIQHSSPDFSLRQSSPKSGERGH